MTDKFEDNELFETDDFVFTKDGEGNVVGGGYKIKSYFLQGGLSPMTTYNNNDNDNEQEGGKVSSPFENLAVPAGLFYVNMRVPKKSNESDSEDQYQYNYHQMASDEMIDKLFELVEVDKKRKRKTKKHHIKTYKTKTRRHK